MVKATFTAKQSLLIVWPQFLFDLGKTVCLTLPVCTLQHPLQRMISTSLCVYIHYLAQDFSSHCTVQCGTQRLNSLNSIVVFVPFRRGRGQRTQLQSTEFIIVVYNWYNNNGLRSKGGCHFSGQPKKTTPGGR